MKRWEKNCTMDEILENMVTQWMKINMNDENMKKIK